MRNCRRPYTPEEVARLRGSVKIDYSLARLGAEKLEKLLSTEKLVRALGALTGMQAVQQIQAGLKVIYVSGWQIASDMNDALETYPDLSLYPVASAPHLIRRIQNALMRMDQIDHLDRRHERRHEIDWLAPIIADAEAGFGGPLNTYELVRAMIREGAAAIHLEDQLSSLKKCGHMGGKVLVPVHEFIEKLIAARLAADTMDVPTLLIARTDAEGARFIRSDADPIDKPFVTAERSSEGFFGIKSGTDYAIERALAFAPYADILWCETSKPDLVEAKKFAEKIHAAHPGKWLAYNCSPSFNWSGLLKSHELAHFQEALADLGYKFQFVTLAGFHTLNASMFALASRYKKEGMGAYARFQEEEFALEKEGFRAVKHQSFVGAGYFDEILMTITSRASSTTALEGSTEQSQF